MRLIDADALLNNTILNPLRVPYATIKEIGNAPTIEAVPLDALCNWLAVQDFRVRGEPIVAKLDTETWANVIRECVMREAGQ